MNMRQDISLTRVNSVRLSGFNRHPIATCRLARPERYPEIMAHAPHCIARGCGSSYSDAAINTSGVVISMLKLNRLLAFDAEKGQLTAQAGATLRDICQFCVPKGWFLPVMPGTAWVSLGGAIAADVHGKNHWQAGSFSQSIIWLECITANGESIHCSAHQNADLFWATVGGMGLTGLIGTVCLQLKPISSPYLWVEPEKTSQLDQTLTRLHERQLTHDYQVAWLDGCAKSSQRGRGIILSAVHATGDESN